MGTAWPLPSSLTRYDAEEKGCTAYHVDIAGVMAPVAFPFKDKALTLSWDMKMGGEPDNSTTTSSRPASR